MIVSFSGEYRFLSNFYKSPIGPYPTLEHAFQAAKTPDLQWQRRIGGAPTPGDAKRLGKKCPMHPQWDDIKVGVMWGLLIDKFDLQKRPMLANQLLATGQEVLIEGNSWGDTFWGMTIDSEARLFKSIPRVEYVVGKQTFIYAGQNWLGHLLMAVRSGLQLQRM